MIASLGSLSFVNVSYIIKSLASLVLEAGEGDRDGEFSSKIQVLHFLHSHAMEATHWAYLFTVMDSPCAQLARCRRASPALSLPCIGRLGRGMRRTEAAP